MAKDHFRSRVALLDDLQRQRRELDRAGSIVDFDRYRQEAISMLTGNQVHKALDIHNVDDKIQERYGRNSFGWSLLMARKLVQAGVSIVQENMGYDESS